MVTIYRTLGMNFNERVLPSIGYVRGSSAPWPRAEQQSLLSGPHAMALRNEILKAVVAKYNAEELLSKRQTISDLIRQVS